MSTVGIKNGELKKLANKGRHRDTAIRENMKSFRILEISDTIVSNLFSERALCLFPQKQILSAFASSLKFLVL